MPLKRNKPLPRKAKPLPKNRKPRRGPLKDKAYLAWIRESLCIICFPTLWRNYRDGQLPKCEAAHVGERGLGQRCSDRETLPLCASHHRTGKDSHHVLGKGFWEYHSLNRDAIISELQRLYELDHAAEKG